MALDTEHVLAAVGLGSGTGATIIGAITNDDLTRTTQVMNDPTSGDVYPRHQAVASQEERGTFTTKAIADALDAIALTGSKIDDLSGGLSLYAQKLEKGGGRASGSVHRKHAIAAGMITLGSISVQHQDDAELSVNVAVGHDGSANPPIIPSDTNAAPANVDNERFTIGPVTLGGVTIDQILSVNLDFGVQVVLEAADSDIYATMYYISQVLGTLRVVTRDVTLQKQTGGIPEIGVNGTHADSIWYLKKRASGGGFVANGTAQHIKFTTGGIVHVEKPHGADGADPHELTVVQQLRFTGETGITDPITWDTTSAIT